MNPAPNLWTGYKPDGEDVPWFAPPGSEARLSVYACLDCAGPTLAVPSRGGLARCESCAKKKAGVPPGGVIWDGVTTGVPVAPFLASLVTGHLGEPEAWPAPEIPAVEVAPIDVWWPRTRAFAQAAVSAGWTIRVTYARGTAGTRVLKVVDTIAVRLRHPRLLSRCAAVWQDSSFSFAVGFGPEMPLRSMGYREVLAWISER